MTARYFRETPKTIPDIETLVDVLIFKVANHFKLGKRSTIYKVLERLGQVTAKRFAAIMQRFDQRVGEKSIWEAARDVLKEFTDGWDAKGLKGNLRIGSIVGCGKSSRIRRLSGSDGCHIKIELLDLPYDIGLIITILGIKYCIK